jgi:hypothetical protein
LVGICEKDEEKKKREKNKNKSENAKGDVVVEVFQYGNQSYSKHVLNTYIVI